MHNAHDSAPKTPVTWILVADGQHARVYTRSSGEQKALPTEKAIHPHFTESSQALTLVPGMEWKAKSSAIHDAGSKNPAKVHESMGMVRHGTEPHLTIGDEIKQLFTTRVAHELSRAWASKLFDKLVLVAPAKMLGDLRDQLDKSLCPHVVASLSKDLTHLAPRELMSHLKDIA